MEKFPFRPESETAVRMGAPSVRSVAPVTAVTASAPADWRQGLPLIASGAATIRELQREDAISLFAMLATEEVARFISPPPTTLDGFEAFIAWTHQERTAGRLVCFGVVPTGLTAAVGIIQLRALDADFGLAEWGFAIGSPFWGTGAFVDAAATVVDFAIDRVGVHRLEARATITNGRGNGALRKIGANTEGVLRRSFFRHGEYHDQLLWSILADEWRVHRIERRERTH
ncbi:MAG TPA: GNAT family N-acetyltransferase [Vicinamibacterales bacterium]|nr:GNAT family N-acetyltransferase [Vicinamibacterales bacterium]